MKANSLKKKIYSLEEVYATINSANDMGEIMCFFPRQAFISEEIKLQLLQDGFKCYIGTWDSFNYNAFIIEW